MPTIIDPGGDVTVHGPHADATLTSLQVGGGTGIATLWLHGGALVTVPTVNVTSTGVLAGNGPIVGNILNDGLIRPENISANNIQNNAVIDLDTIDARLQSSNTVTNDGTITGDGTLLAIALINNGLVDVGRLTVNGSCIDNFGELRLSRAGAIVEDADEFHNMGLIRGSGTIDVGVFDNVAGAEIRIGDGERLEFQVIEWTSTGLLEVLGGDFESNFLVFNGGSGLIAGRDATFRFGPGLINSAAFAITFGTSDVFGDVTNDAAGSIVLTGNSNTTFYDDVTNNGVFQVSNGSTVVFLGDFVGANGVSGPGTVFMEGDLRPGNSPATVSFGGDLHFGALASLEIELGGTLAGTEFDQIDVGAIVDLGGTLDVQLTGGFVPTAGDRFEIITAASILGAFDTETLPTLPGDLVWFVNYSGTSVELISTFPGDFDFDSEVDGADFLEWQRGESLNPLSASDLADWEANFGNVAPLASTSTAVPEPSSIALLVAGLVCVTPRSRNGKSEVDACARPINSRL